MKKMNYKPKNLKSGFTILETIVALTIFSVSILGIVVITGRGISDLSIAKDKLTGLYLAQEGIELARNVRDNHLLSSDDNYWATFLSDISACTGTSGCTINPTLNTNPTACSTSDGCYITANGTSGRFFGRSTGPLEKFYRKITMVSDGNNRVTVTSTVKWQKGQVTLTTEIYNWK